MRTAKRLKASKSIVLLVLCKLKNRNEGVFSDRQMKVREVEVRESELESALPPLCNYTPLRHIGEQFIYDVFRVVFF